MAIRWEYNTRTHRYVNADTGATLTPKELVTIRDNYVLAREEYVRGLAEQLAAGTITPERFGVLFREATAESIAVTQALGAGGWENVASMPGSAQQLQALLDKQTPFATDFLRELANGALSADEIAARAALYQSAAIHSYEVANSSESGIDLPYYPGDWSSECKAGDRCAWIIETEFDGDDEVTYATWQTEQDGEVCDTCAARGEEWQRREIARTPRTDPLPHGMEQAA